MENYGSVMIDAYRTYNTSFRTVMEGFVGSGDPKLGFVFDDQADVLHLVVCGECEATPMRESVRSMGHDLYMPFTGSLENAERILGAICNDYSIDSRFRSPALYSDPERYVTGAVEVPEIIAEYGYIHAMTPSIYWDHSRCKTYASRHLRDKERQYIEWENPKEVHAAWMKTIWMKNEFHYGYRCRGFVETENMEPILRNAVLDIKLPGSEIGRLSGLTTKMLEDFNRVGRRIR